MNSIEINGVSKSYGQIQALDGVTTTLEPGRIYGLLGRNGAGKTTLLNILSNRIFANSGTITMDGESVVENDRAQRQIYHMSEQLLFPEEIRVRDAIKWGRHFYDSWDMDRTSHLLEVFGLDPKRRIHKLSTGYQSIAKAIFALSCGAPYILFDEPVLGLDANHRELFYKEMIRLYADTGCTVVLSTHLIEEAADLIEHVIILHQGRVLRDEDSESILAKAWQINGPAEAVDQFTADSDAHVLSTESLGGLKSALLDGPRPGVLPETITFSKVNLQQLFIALTQS